MEIFSFNQIANHLRMSLSTLSQDFFTWIDEGAGSTLDLPHYPREKLETNRVTYLDDIERQAYAVYVRDDGMLAYRQSKGVVNTEVCNCYMWARASMRSRSMF